MSLNQKLRIHVLCFNIHYSHCVTFAWSVNENKNLALLSTFNLSNKHALPWL